jgi:two-component system, chemotaxis family, protein-glutamate methylesterase/glutaminase
VNLVSKSNLQDNSLNFNSQNFIESIQEQSGALEPTPTPTTHDIIVMGTSAGGVEALQRLVRDLPADLPAAVFIVVHVSPDSPGLMPAILQTAGNLPVSQPENGEIIELGHIYVAPPDNHMVIDHDIIRVVRGPKENRHRPAIDPLFRSAARYYGSRVIGVILTGMLDDGVAGLLFIKRLGGLAVVQDPASALYPDMPRNALERVKEVDYLVPLTEIGPLLTKLVNEMSDLPPEQEKKAITEQLKIEDNFALSNIPHREILNEIGKPATIACPDCHGTLWEVNDSDLLRFRCRVGHAFSAMSLLEDHAEELESALWSAMRNLAESASLNRRLAERARADNRLLSASSFMESAVEAEQQADLIKKVLLTNKTLGEQKEI